MILRVNMSIMNAAWPIPAHVVAWVMSATHSRFGVGAVKSFVHEVLRESLRGRTLGGAHLLRPCHTARPPPDAEPRGLVAADVPSLTFQEGVHLPYPVDAVVLLVQIFDHGKEQLVAQLARGGRAGLRGGDATRAASPDSYQAGLRHVGLWSSGSDARRRLGPGLASAVCARASRESTAGSSWTILTSRTERNPGRFMLSLGTWCAD